ncbi:MAG TPA: hypothetical protein VNE39_24570 [Planctomycetota bacterium]|nr:hypothetical protein [Planctomycetota bacterium]
MDATTKALCGLLQRGEPELRAAVARVLAELRPAEGPVLAALGAVVASDSGPAGLYALRALAASPAPEAVEHILPALAGPLALQQEAVEAVVRFGRNAVPSLKKAVLDAPLPIRSGAAGALARIGGKAAHEALLRALGEGDLELSKHVCLEFDHAIQPMGMEERAALAELVRGYLAQKRTLEIETAAASGLILLGFLQCPKSKATLLGFARPRRAPELRRRALLALRGIGPQLTAGELKTLAGYLREEDLANVALPAIELLRPLALPPAAADLLLPLTNSSHQAVRDFAVYKMGGLVTPAAAKALVEQLDAPQPALRELAVSSLQRNPAAAALLLKRLRTEANPGRVWTLVRILEHHAAAIPTATAKTLIRTLVEHLENGDKRVEPLSYLAHRAAPKLLDAALLKRATALKDKGRFAEADRMLTTLLRGGAACPEATYQGAVVALKLSPKGISRHERHADPCLERFAVLLELPEADLADRLASEKCLKPEELFYVGFHFAEQLAERREFGGALLRRVVALGPRTTLAANARNKLRLEAFPPVEEAQPPKGRSGKKTPRVSSRK